MSRTNDMKLIMEDWRKFVNEEAPPSGNDPKVRDFLKLYAKQKPKTMQKALGIAAKWTAGIAVGLLVGSAAGATTAGLGTGAGVVAGGAAAKAAEQAIGMIYDKVAERSGDMAKGLIAYLSTPDDSNDPLAAFFDIEDEYEKLLQGLDSDLGEKFQKELFGYYKRVFEQIDEEADGDKPLSEFLESTANQFFQRFLFKQSKSGVGVKVQPSR
jgi:hypothetical protein